MVTVEDLIEDVTATVSLEKLRALVQQFNARGNEIHYLQLLMGDRNRDIKQLRAALSQAKTMTFAGMDGFRTAFWEMAEAMNIPAMPISPKDGYETIMKRRLEYVRRLVGKLENWLLTMSYNESYFGEPVGDLKSTVKQLTHLVKPIHAAAESTDEDYSVVEDYIRAIPWSEGTPDIHITLVAGNIRGFYQHLRREGKIAGMRP